MSMDNADLDREMAELMGWVECFHNGVLCWCHSGDYDMIMPQADWHPSTDIAQAMMVVERMLSRGFNIKKKQLVNYRQYSHITGHEVLFSFERVDNVLGRAFAKDLGTAICKAASKVKAAARQVKAAMEEGGDAK